MGVRGSERGQVVPLLTLVVLLAGLVCLGVGKLGGAAVARAQATTAADAAALAGAASGRMAANDFAAANGGRVTGYQQLGTVARVDVALGRAQASARAQRTGGSGDEGPAGPSALAPATQAALARAAQLLGRTVPLVPSPGGTLPGDARIRHARGLAVDVPATFVATLAPVAVHAGLCQPYRQTHPVHFELCAYGLP